MVRRLLLNIDADERRAAIVDGQRLEALAIESSRDARKVGNVFKGIVKRVEPSLQAAFVDFGGKRDGFLSASEVLPSLAPKGVDRRAPLQKILHPKQELLLQVTKDEVGNKGAALTTYVSLAGRFLVLMPDSERVGVSRKLSDEERRRLKEVLASVTLPDGFGVIARTAARAVTKADATKDLNYLTRLWNGIERQFDEMKGPGLIYEEGDLAIRFVRDNFTPDIDEIWVDDGRTHQEIAEFVGLLTPRQRNKVRLYTDDLPLFNRYQIEAQIDHVFARRVPLPSGGSIVIDETEALVAIDVNSGRTKRGDAEETVFKSNMEAAEEIGRHARLRDLGGLIVIDFIDMEKTGNKRKVETALRQAFKNDKARVNFGRISSFGLMEMSRQRLKNSLWRTAFRPCEHCEGAGRIRSDESAALRVLRQLRDAATREDIEYVRADLPPSLAHYLLNRRRRELAALERQTGVRVEIFDDPGILSHEVHVEAHDVKLERPERRSIRPAVHLHGAAPEGGGGPSKSESDAFTMYDPDLTAKARAQEETRAREAAQAAEAERTETAASEKPAVPSGPESTTTFSEAQARSTSGAPIAAGSDKGASGKSTAARWLKRLLGVPEDSEPAPPKPAPPKPAPPKPAPLKPAPPKPESPKPESPRPTARTVVVPVPPPEAKASTAREPEPSEPKTAKPESREPQSGAKGGDDDSGAKTSTRRRRRRGGRGRGRSGSSNASGGGDSGEKKGDDQGASSKEEAADKGSGGASKKEDGTGSGASSQSGGRRRRSSGSRSRSGSAKAKSTKESDTKAGGSPAGESERAKPAESAGEGGSKGGSDENGAKKSTRRRRRRRPSGGGSSSTKTD